MLIYLRTRKVEKKNLGKRNSLEKNIDQKKEKTLSSLALKSIEKENEFMKNETKN